MQAQTATLTAQNPVALIGGVLVLVVVLVSEALRTLL